MCTGHAFGHMATSDENLDGVFGGDAQQTSPTDSHEPKGGAKVKLYTDERYDDVEENISGIP